MYQGNYQKSEKLLRTPITQIRKVIRRENKFAEQKYPVSLELCPEFVFFCK